MLLRLPRLHCHLASRRRPRLMRGHGCTAPCRRIVLCYAIPPSSKSPATWLMLLSPPALVVDPILSENRRKRSTLAPIVSNDWPSGLALHYGNFLKPLSYASCTSYFAIGKARSSVKWGCALRVVKRRPLFFAIQLSKIKLAHSSATFQVRKHTFKASVACNGREVLHGTPARAARHFGA